MANKQKLLCYWVISLKVLFTLIPSYDVQWLEAPLMSLLIETNGKPSAAADKFPNAICTLMVGKILATNRLVIIDKLVF